MIHDERLLRLPEVQRLTGLGKSSIYEFARTGRFVRPIKLTSRCSVWPESAVRAWISEHVKGAASDATGDDRSACTP